MLDKDGIKSHPQESVSIFSELSNKHQGQIFAQTSHLSIKAGQTLINEGEDANNLYFLEQGSLIVYSGKKAIAQILAGEPIGEIAFLTGGKRTASVVASRSSKLLQLDKQTYTNLTKEIPELTQAIIQALAKRLKTNNSTTPELEPKVSNIVALLPASDCAKTENLIKKMFDIKNEINSSWKVKYADDLASIDQLFEWIKNNEEKSKQLILIASSSSEHSEMALAMAEHSDKTFLILDKSHNNSHPISNLEQSIYKSSLFNSVDLIILRESNSEKITGTSKLLDGRQIHLHHHIALNQQADIERIQRFIAGKAIGLILCGGGAMGTAHLGMIKALKEHDYSFDIIGGTSIGSVIASIYAMGHDPDEALNHLEHVFINKKALGKYSIPLHSFVDHKHVDEELKKLGNNTDIEDLPINYFAVATNLSNNQLQTFQNGPLWKAVRSSCSLPGILPPFITDDGDVLIDGGLMDNTPISSIRSIKSGPNVVMNFTPLKPWKVNSNYNSIPRGWTLLKNIILPKSKSREYYPSIFTILSRAMVTNTIKRFSEIDQRDDIFLEPTRLNRMGMMSWKKSRKQFELSYQEMKTALLKTEDDSNNDKINNLRNIAKNMKIGK